jgi:hypothetical protein
MASKITAEFDKKFKEILRHDAGKANEVLQTALKCLEEHKLSYVLKKVHCRFFLTHKANRGGLLLSPYNAHRNAAKIDAGGGDRKQLTNAICMELAPCGSLRAEHLEANQQLIERAKLLLAEINGEERYITLGCGHTAAWCKHAAVGGRTPEKSLQDEFGNIDVQKVKRNNEFRLMIEEGWDWLVVPHEIDAAYPKFAQIAQKALNVANHVSSAVSELEAAVTLATTANDPGMQDIPNWKDVVIDSVQALSPPCSSYVSVLLEFVLLYGGGPEAPQVLFMDAFAKQYGCSVALGETFWTTLTNQQFQTKTCKFPQLRIALALCNLLGDKVEDGIAKFIVRSDIVKVASKQFLPEAEKFEKALSDATEIAAAIASPEVALKPLGQLFVRVGCIATNKEEKGGEGKKLTLDAAKSAFLLSLGQAVGHPVTFDTWAAPVAAPAAAASAPAVGKKRAAASLSDHNDPVWLALQSGFEVGKNVMEKKADNKTVEERLFVVFSISKDGIVLKQLCSYTGTPKEVKTSLPALISEWTVCRDQVSGPIRADCGHQRPESLFVDLVRAMLYKALLEVDAQHMKSSAAQSLVFWRRPDEARTSKTIAKGQLVLVPIANIHAITTKKTDQALSLGKHKVLDSEKEFFVVPACVPSRQKESDADKFPDILVSAWPWVAERDDPKLVNMVPEIITKHGVEIPVLRNSVDIPPFKPLIKLNVKKAVAKAAAAKPAAAKPAAEKPTKRHRKS